MNNNYYYYLTNVKDLSHWKIIMHYIWAWLWNFDKYWKGCTEFTKTQDINKNTSHQLSTVVEEWWMMLVLHHHGHRAIIESSMNSSVYPSILQSNVGPSVQQLKIAETGSCNRTVILSTTENLQQNSLEKQKKKNQDFTMAQSSPQPHWNAVAGP